MAASSRSALSGIVAVSATMSAAWRAAASAMSSSGTSAPSISVS